MATLEITITDDNSRGAYRAAVEGGEAELTWHRRGEVRVADHTFTPPSARGKGIALQLVEAMVADAREKGFTIRPSCPYVVAQFRRHPDWSDVLAE